MKFDPATPDYSATVSNSVTSTTVRATVAVSGATRVDYYPGAQVDLEVGDNDIEVTVTSADGDTEKEYTVEVYRRAPSNVISGTITDAVSGDGISSVRVTVTVGLVGGSTDSKTGARYVTTDRDGEYTANVESGTGETKLTPSKADYTFDPEMRTVQLDAGSVTGIDFTGSTYGTITGTVTDENGNGLAGVKVTAGSEDPVTTARRGSYSVDVPAGNVLVTAELGGYDFDPVSVNVIAGETRTLDFDARGTIQPTNVEGERDVVAGAFDGNVTVTWDGWRP